MLRIHRRKSALNVVTVTPTLCNLRGAVAGLDQDVPALGTKCCCDGLREGLDTDEEGGAGVDAEFELLRRPVSTNSRFCRSVTDIWQVETHLVGKPELL
jgi:hypothetical protein